MELDYGNKARVEMGLPPILPKPTNYKRHHNSAAKFYFTNKETGKAFILVVKNGQLVGRRGG